MCVAGDRGGEKDERGILLPPIGLDSVAGRHHCVCGAPLAGTPHFRRARAPKPEWGGTGSLHILTSRVDPPCHPPLKFRNLGHRAVF